MNHDYRKRAHKYWEDIHRKQSYDRESIRVDDWLERFDDIIMQAQNPILDLGCGGGNDTLYLILKGKPVVASDMSECAVSNIMRNYPEVYKTLCFNMLDGFPFDDNSFEVVIADLCLHYFTETDTQVILSEIRRIIAPGGHLILRVNSVNDVNYGAGQGKEVEHHLYESESGTLKRFFDEEDIYYFFKDFKIEYVKEDTMSRYKLVKKLFTLCCKCI